MEKTRIPAPPDPPIGRSQSGLLLWWGSEVSPPVHPPLIGVALELAGRRGFPRAKEAAVAGLGFR